MLRLALIFFLFSLIAALFGFGGISAAAAGMAEILFYVFVALFIFSLVYGLSTRDDRAVKKHM